MKVQLLIKSKGQSPAQLLTFAQGVADSLRSNASFPDLFPPVKTLDEDIANLSKAISDNMRGNKHSNVLLSGAVEALKRTLKMMAAYVEYQSNNDQAIALSSGFQLKRLSQRSAQGFEADYGEHSGTVDLKCPHRSHSSYVWEYSTDVAKEENWFIAGNSMQAHFRITDLAPGIRYWFRVSLVTKDGLQPPGDPISIIVV